MADLTELEQRIKDALARIEAGAEALAERPAPEPPAPAPAPAGAEAEELGSLREALDAERTANAQLEERIKALHERHETELTALRAENDELREQAQNTHARNKALRLRLGQTKQALQAAREAGKDAITDPHLVNQAMQTELEGLQALRDSDRAELDTLLAALEPLVEEKADA